MKTDKKRLSFRRLIYLNREGRIMNNIINNFWSSLRAVTFVTLIGFSSVYSQIVINEIMYNHYLQYITTDNLYITGYLIDSKNVIYGV